MLPSAFQSALRSVANGNLAHKANVRSITASAGLRCPRHHDSAADSTFVSKGGCVHQRAGVGGSQGRGPRVRLAKHIGPDGLVAKRSVGQVVAAIKAEMAALDVEGKFIRIEIEAAPEP